MTKDRTITIGEIEPSQRVVPILHRLPPTVIDAGWVVPFVVNANNGWFGGLAFPSLCEGKPLVGLIAMKGTGRGALSEEEMFDVFPLVHEDVRSQVIQKWQSCWNNCLDTRGAKPVVYQSEGVQNAAFN